jgi:hypothetical protein
VHSGCTAVVIEIPPNSDGGYRSRLGDKTKAIDYLKREYLNHDNINPTGVDAMLDGLRGDPRFEALAERPQ